MKLLYRRFKFLFVLCALSALFFCARNSKKTIAGVYYSPCNEYQYAIDTIALGLYPRPYFDFSSEDDSVTIFYSDATTRKMYYSFFRKDSLKIDQYGDWFFDQSANQLIWDNPFEEKTYTDCPYTSYFFVDTATEDQKKHLILEIFQQKARDIFAPHTFVYGEDTLRFEADGTLKGIEGFSYYEIDQKNHRLDYSLIYFKNTPTFFADLEDKSNINLLAFVLTREKLDFYLIDEYKKEPIDHLITYQVLQQEAPF